MKNCIQHNELWQIMLKERIIKNEKTRYFSLLIVIAFLCVWCMPVFAQVQRVVIMRAPCQHGSNYHTIPYKVAVTGWNAKEHWVTTEYHYKCSVSGCNGSSYSDQITVYNPHITPTQYTSQSCSGGYHSFYGTCKQSYCQATVLIARINCNGSNHPSPYVVHPVTE